MLRSQYYFHGAYHDPDFMKNQASSMLTSINQLLSMLSLLVQVRILGVDSVPDSWVRLV